jgi:alpha-galactosidase
MTAWRIDAPTQTLVLHANSGIPVCVYWGARLPDAENLAAIVAAGEPDLTGGMLDAVVPLSLCPESSRSFPGQAGFVAYRNGRPLHPKFSLIAVRDGEFTCGDDDLGLLLTFTFRVINDVITAQTSLTATGEITVHHLAAPVLPAPQTGQILHYSGRWIGEFIAQRSDWQAGMLKREARTGRSGHEHPPLAFFCEDGCSNTVGTAFGMHYAWPGGHVMIAEELPDGRRQIQWGHASGTWEPVSPFSACPVCKEPVSKEPVSKDPVPKGPIPDAPEPKGAQSTYVTAPLVLTRSQSGLNGCAQALSGYIRDHVVQWPDKTRPRPVHYNCWEAVYFDHNLADLTDIATRAAALGAERFVLDDGWFGRRDDDSRSLGDWQVDLRKWPMGLTPLIDHVHGLGMTFGLWIEPEMVNMNSDLARAHPEWILGRADQTEGRQQRVLDLANVKVRLHLLTVIDDLLSRHSIEYLKWDHNRLLPHPDAAQAQGILTLLADVRARHPMVEIESCASGGGRIDAGILAHTHRVWLSDSNDALERFRIQHEAAVLLPWEVCGAHVGPRKCHTSGRILDIRFRAWVAAQRHMGFEMDPRELTPDEAQVLTRVTQWWKDNRDWRAGAAILRLDCADPAVLAEMQISGDGGQFVAFVGQLRVSDQITPRPLRLAGLDPNARYQVELINRDQISNLSRGHPALKTGALKTGAVTLTGQALMSMGLALPYALPETCWVLEGRKL